MNEKETKQEEVKQDDAENKEMQQPEEAPAEVLEDDSAEQIKQLQHQIQDLNEQVNKWKTDYYKVFADMENLKRRLKNEHDNALKFMMQDMASDLLPIVDNLQRALTQETNEETKSFLKGFEMITDQLLAVLKKHGVEEIEALGKEFDPKFHQAVMMTNVEGVDSNIITEELQKGYKLKDRVIRASLVKVNE